MAWSGSSNDLQAANEHTARFSSLYKAWQKRKDGKSNTEFWDYLKPELQYAGVEPGQTPPPGAVPVGVLLVGIGCNKQPQSAAAVKTMLCDQGEVALAAVADRVLSQHATVCAVDRVWSELGNMFAANRSRLAVAKGNKMMLVRNSYRMQNGITNSDKEMETAFWIEDLAEVDS